MRSNSSPAGTGATISPAPQRQYRSKLERRRIVEETLVQGASVAVIARSHGVNANQVFHWRKLYRDGRLDVQPPATQFLPARIVESSHVMQGRMEANRGYPGAIDIEIGDVRVRITGSADPNCIRAALEHLRR